MRSHNFSVELSVVAGDFDPSVLEEAIGMFRPSALRYVFALSSFLRPSTPWSLINIGCVSAWGLGGPMMPTVFVIIVAD